MKILHNRRHDDLVRGPNRPFNPWRDCPQLSDKSMFVGKDLKAQLRVLVIMTMILYLVAGVIMWWVWSQQQINTRSLCAIRREAQHRVRDQQTYLSYVTSHPNIITGLSAPQIQQDLDASIDTVTALQILGSC